MTVQEKLTELEKIGICPSHYQNFDGEFYTIDYMEQWERDTLEFNFDVQLLDIEILLSDARGIYIPANFIECFDFKQWGISESDSIELNNPDNEFYWDTWDMVLSNAYFIDDNGKKWYLYQEGDLFAISYYS